MFVSEINRFIKDPEGVKKKKLELKTEFDKFKHFLKRNTEGPRNFTSVIRGRISKKEKDHLFHPHSKILMPNKKHDDGGSPKTRKALSKSQEDYRRNIKDRIHCNQTTFLRIYSAGPTVRPVSITKFIAASIIQKFYRGYRTRKLYRDVILYRLIKNNDKEKKVSKSKPHEERPSTSTMGHKNPKLSIFNPQMKLLFPSHSLIPHASALLPSYMNPTLSSIPNETTDFGLKLIDFARKDDLQGFELLRKTVLKKHTKMLDLLGNTALHYACMNQNMRFTKLLLKAGADPFQYNFEGKTPNHFMTPETDRDF